MFRRKSSKRANPISSPSYAFFYFSLRIFFLQIKRMIHRAAACTQIQHCRQRTGDIFLRTLHCGFQIISLCQICRNRTGKRTACAMCIGVINALSAEPMCSPFIIKQVIRIIHAVSALTKHRTMVGLTDEFRRRHHIRRGSENRPDAASAPGCATRRTAPWDWPYDPPPPFRSTLFRISPWGKFSV